MFENVDESLVIFYSMSFLVVVGRLDFSWIFSLIKLSLFESTVFPV